MKKKEFQNGNLICYAILEVVRFINNHKINVDGFPFAKSYGEHGNFNVLVMQLLGKSLDNIFEEHNKKFSIKDDKRGKKDGNDNCN